MRATLFALIAVLSVPSAALACKAHADANKAKNAKIQAKKAAEVAEVKAPGTDAAASGKQADAKVVADATEKSAPSKR